MYSNRAVAQAAQLTPWYLVVAELLVYYLLSQKKIVFFVNCVCKA